MNARKTHKDDDEGIERVIIDLTSVNRIDLSGLHMLSSLEDKLKAEGIALALVGAKGSVEDTFQRWFGVSQRTQPFIQYHTVGKALQAGVDHTKVCIAVDGKAIAHVEETKSENVRSRPASAGGQGV